MKTTILSAILFAITLCVSMAAQSRPAEIISITEPKQSIGIQIGDIMQRRIILAVEQPYQVSKSAFPRKGERVNNIELADVQINTAQRLNHTIYTITLSYQVFAYSSTARVMHLPEVAFAATGGPEAVTIKLPMRRFWYSPLAQGSIHKVRANLQPQYSPTLIDLRPHQTRLIFFASLLLIGITGLIYINLDRRWLPWMNGAFAQAYRRLKKLPEGPQSHRQALLVMHQAFNSSYGTNLFADRIEDFLQKRPKFAQYRDEINVFFEHSSQALFAPQNLHNDHLVRDLQVLSKQLRSCERGVA